MSRFVGNKCIVCKQKFSEKDDIVVCPDCGTPYHRSCFAEAGICVNQKLHESGESWKPEVTAEKSAESGKCPQCGSMNKPESKICQHCGAILDERLRSAYNNAYGEKQRENGNRQFNGEFSFEPWDQYCGLNPEEDFESVKTREIAAFVKTNQIYYLPMFKKFKEIGKKISFNLFAFFLPEFYFANRKMWSWTVISVFVTVILSMPTFIADLSDVFKGVNIDMNSKFFQTLLYASSLAYFAYKLFAMLFANWIYYRHTLKKVKSMKASSENVSKADLSESGGTSLGGVFISFAAESFLSMLIFCIFSILLR